MGQIKVEKNAGGIQGLCVIEPTVHGDARGYFMETYNQKDMEEFLGTVVTYMATATDDEYEEIAQTIRHESSARSHGECQIHLNHTIPNTR